VAWRELMRSGASAGAWRAVAVTRCVIIITSAGAWRCWAVMRSGASAGAWRG
jgi:hypothetical protein